ncbi:MAG: D-alanyl-D-alanine carboxypeptidase/D-alanyl-D-alanine-endopeptidase, partial [Methanomicrobiales archaeon HGW-Methanomicrobiales-5]
PASLSLIDGEGSSENRVSPEAGIDLLRVMAAGNTSRVYRAAMPVLGIDGSLAGAAAPGNPAIGKIAAKTGTSLQSDMNGDLMLVAKGLAGYMTTKGGRDVMFVLYANNVRISSLDDLNAINTDMGSFAGALYEAF